MHKNHLQVWHGFLQQPIFTLAFNLDCSRTLLSASGKINYCISGNEKEFDTHTHTPHTHRTVGWKWAYLKPADAVQPPEIQTWLLGKAQGEDGSFHIYNDHNKQTLFLTSAAEFRYSFPITTHIAMVTVSFHFSTQVVYAVSPSSLSSFKCKKSATRNKEKQVHKENCHSMNATEICILQLKNKYMNDQPLNASTEWKTRTQSKRC